MFGKLAVIATLAAAMLAPGAGAQRQDTTVNVLAIERPGMADVRVTRGLRYQDTLTMDVYRAPSQARGTRRPAVLFVHGGLVARASGASPTTWASYQSWGRLVAASGFVGVTFNHRLDTDEELSAPEQQIRSAMRYVRAHADELDIDRDRLCLAFYSAGGQVASAVLRDPQPFVRCVVLLYPYLDLEHHRRATPFRGPMAAAHVDSEVPRYSPAALLARNPSLLPPLFVAMAGHDAIPSLNESIERFMRAALANRIRIDFALHPTGVHGFDQRDHDERSREILESVMTFYRTHLTL